RRTAQVGTNIEALGLVGRLEGAHGSVDPVPDRFALRFVQLLQFSHVAGWQDHQMPAGVGVGVEDGGGQVRGMGPDQGALLVRHPGGQDGAEDAVLVAGAGDPFDVLAPPPRPEPLERAHGWAAASAWVSISARRAAAKSATGTPRSGRSFSR